MEKNNNTTINGSLPSTEQPEFNLDDFLPSKPSGVLSQYVKNQKDKDDIATGDVSSVGLTPEKEEEDYDYDYDYGLGF
jgi:hypothetical protein